LQAIDDFRFEAAHVIPCCFAKPTMKLPSQANTDQPTPRVLHQDKGSDNNSNGQANAQASKEGNGDGHGDTPHRSGTARSEEVVG
jgi:hypothetical protein